MINKTAVKASTLPKFGVYNKKGTLVASSYKLHASGKIEFYNFRNGKVMSMCIVKFKKNYKAQLID